MVKWLVVGLQPLMKLSRASMTGIAQYRMNRLTSNGLAHGNEIEGNFPVHEIVKPRHYFGAETGSATRGAVEVSLMNQ